MAARYVLTARGRGAMLHDGLASEIRWKLADAQQGLDCHELATRCGWVVSSVQRRLRSMRSAGLVRRADARDE